MNMILHESDAEPRTHVRVLRWPRGVRRHSNLGGPQRLNRIDLYGKKLIPMEKL